MMKVKVTDTEKLTAIVYGLEWSIAGKKAVPAWDERLTYLISPDGGHHPITTESAKRVSILCKHWMSGFMSYNDVIADEILACAN